MILPDKKDAIHKTWLYRVVEAIADDSYLASVMYFKGGTCASMLSWLNRFSVDLDFDYAGDMADIEKTKLALKKAFDSLGLSIKDSSKIGIQYFLKYENSGRNTLKIDAAFPLFKSSLYEKQRFVEIDRILTCQTKETMFAHKLVAVIDRYEKTKSIAGRDIYDIHHFFMSGYSYNTEIIKERRNIEVMQYLKQLVEFIEQNVTETVITEDLSSLLPFKEFSAIRKTLKRETISFLKDEIARL